jgi:hypothetical protein
MRTYAMPRWTILATLTLLCALFVSSCGATDAGRLSARDTWPLVDRLTARQSAYVDAGLRPDGTQMGEAEQMAQRTSLIVLRNAWHAALGQPLEPLPPPPGVPAN